MNIITPTDRKFLCQHRNGATFATNPTTDYVSYLQGNVVENLKLVETVEVSTITEASSNVQILAKTALTGGIILEHPFNTWTAEGFVVGNTIRVEANGNSRSETVSNIVGTRMYITDTSFFATLGTTSGVWRSDYVVKSTTVPTALIYKFGIVKNTDNFPTFYSPLTGEEQVYSANGITGSLTSLNYTGTTQSNLGTVQAKYDGASGTGNYIFTFTIEHVFQTIFYIDDWLGSYQNETIPTTFQGNASYKYVSEMIFANNTNNANEGKLFQDNFLLGSLGFIGQNFNNGAVNYTLQSIAYEDSGANVLTAIDADDTTTVTIQLKNNSGNWTAGVRAYLYHAKLANANEYSAVAQSFDTNFILGTHSNTDGTAASSSGFIIDLLVDINGGDATLLDITFDLTYTIAEKDYIADGVRYFLGIGVENGALSATLSDRVIVHCDQNEWIKTDDITGLITVPQIDIFGSALDMALATPRSNIDTWVNRSYILSGSFRATKEPNSNNGLVQSFAVSVVARIPGTTTFFELSKYTFPLTSSGFSFPLVPVGGTGYQAFKISTTRPVGNVKESADLRAVIFTATVPGSYQNYQEFAWQLGIEVPHREWIQNLLAQNTAPIFYNGTLPDEWYNFNERTSNYSELNDYDIFIFATADMLWDGLTTTYVMASDESYVADFDVDVVGTGWSCAKSYTDSFGNPVSVFYQGGDITATLTFTNPGALLNKLAGEIVVERAGSNGQTNRLSSVVDWTSPENMLEGVAGGTLVSLVEIAGFVILKCVIKGEFLEEGFPINVYGHLTLGR